MSRKPRRISSTGIYHVTLRSVNQQIIFEEDADYQKFLSILSDCKEKYDFEIYAYCLMSNHIHLILSVSPDRISSLFISLESRFVRWYNQKYDRFGYLFQGRFFSKPIENDAYFLRSLIYVHENPVKASICRYPAEYRWSSIMAYYGVHNSLVNVTHACDVLNSRDALHQYFSRETTIEDEAELYEPIYMPRKCNDEQALALFKEITGCSSPAEIQKLGKTNRNNIIRELLANHLSINQVALFCGLSRSTILRIHHGTTSPSPETIN